MFCCQFCNSLSKSGDTPVRAITKTRDRLYYDEEGKIVGEGWEIVEEKNICLKCSVKYNKENN